MSDEGTFEYDVALSFAGEDRAYVEAVAKVLASASVRVFYDKYEAVKLWGADLYQHLSDVYAFRAQYCVTFISQAYAAKLWPKHELRSAQAKAFREHGEYILPARFDDTEVPGILPTTGYIDLRTTSPGELAALIIKKINASRATRSVERTITPTASRDPESARAGFELWGDPEYSEEALTNFVFHNRRVRNADSVISSFSKLGRVEDMRAASLGLVLAGLQVVRVRTIFAIELVLEAREATIFRWAAERACDNSGSVTRGISLTYLVQAILAEREDVGGLERYLATCGMRTDDAPTSATKLIEGYLRLRSRGFRSATIGSA